MKYFTKEFYISEFLSYASKTVKKRKRAAVADEQFFLEMYKKNCDLFLKNENLSDFYKDPVEQLNRIEQYINAPDISEEEKERRLFFKETFLALNEDRIKRGKVYKFDKELHERKFNEIYKQSLEYYSHLPAEILNKIADIRVFALGYASEGVKLLLRKYCKKLRRQLDKIIEEAFAETNKAEDLLSTRLELNDCDNLLITKMNKKDGDVYLSVDNKNWLIIKNANILEGADGIIHFCNLELPNCAESRIIAAELHRENDKFELHFLVGNYNEIEQVEFWYLTILGDDIQIVDD